MRVTFNARHERVVKAETVRKEGEWIVFSVGNREVARFPEADVKCVHLSDDNRESDA